jgi:glycosyltransferase involved in cell wall biosynthesis
VSIKRLAIVSTHPIQYHSPWFRALATHSDIDLEVFFCHQATPKEQAAAGFGVEFDWDVDVLGGYRHRFLKNVSVQPSVTSFRGVDPPEIRQIVEQESFDAVLVNGWHYRSAWQTMRACWRTKTPVMVRSDSHLLTKRSELKRIAKWPFYHWFISKLDACLPVGKWSLEYFLHYGAHPERIFVVPHVVDDNYFQQQTTKLKPRRSELRSQWGFKDSSILYLFAGKFVDKKRPLDFITAIGEANRTNPAIEGLMVGDGPLRELCEKLVQEKGIPIKFSGFLNQSEMPRSYVAADGLVLPSDGGETWGLVVNEAMACGLPCFVSDHVGCGPDLIQSGRTGHLFPVGDTPALASLLGSQSMASLENMGRNAAINTRNHSVNSAVTGVIDAVTFIKGGLVN